MTIVSSCVWLVFMVRHFSPMCQTKFQIKPQHNKDCKLFKDIKQRLATSSLVITGCNNPCQCSKDESKDLCIKAEQTSVNVSSKAVQWRCVYALWGYEDFRVCFIKFLTLKSRILAVPLWNLREQKEVFFFFLMFGQKKEKGKSAKNIKWEILLCYHVLV